MMKMDKFNKLNALIGLVSVLVMTHSFWKVSQTGNIGTPFWVEYFGAILVGAGLVWLVGRARYRHQIAQGQRLTNGWSITTFSGVSYYGEKSDDGQHFRWVELTSQKKYEFIGIGLLLVPGQRRSIFAMAFTGG